MAFFFVSCWMVFFCCWVVVVAVLDNNTSPTAIFHTRPEVHAPVIHFDLLDPDLVSPGYIFLAPYRNIDSGPYIYDNHGNLVWSGAADWGPVTAHAPHLCRYHGSDHLCFFRGHQHQGFSRGQGVIVNQSYQIVKTVESAGSGAVSDMHEFRLIDDGRRALITVYQTRQYDLSPFGVTNGIGWIIDGVFQEIDVETGELLFEWHSLDHDLTSPLASYVGAGTTDTSGDGLAPGSPWDYFHINSVDKNADGDYLISARHMAGVYKLSGADGRILWSLNGAQSTFTLADGLDFSSQHHARWRAENATHTILSLFDNASNAYNTTHPQSRGMLIVIDHESHIAALVQEYRAPQDKGISAGSQGNIELLPNGNVFLGWGDHAFFSEHLANGTAVSYAKLAYWGSNVMMYRCAKFPWRGTPRTNPTLWTFSRTGSGAPPPPSSLQASYARYLPRNPFSPPSPFPSSPSRDTTTGPHIEKRDLPGGMTFHASWNGATDVAAWAFYASSSPRGPWLHVGRAPRTGFETAFRHPAGAWAFAYAEALDARGATLRRSAVARTFVPSRALALAACDEFACRNVPVQEGKDGKGKGGGRAKGGKRPLSPAQVKDRGRAVLGGLRGGVVSSGQRDSAGPLLPNEHETHDVGDAGAVPAAGWYPSGPLAATPPPQLEVTPMMRGEGTEMSFLLVARLEAHERWCIIGLLVLGAVAWNLLRRRWWARARCGVLALGERVVARGRRASGSGNEEKGLLAEEEVVAAS